MDENTSDGEMMMTAMGTGKHIGQPVSHGTDHTGDRKMAEL